MPRVLEKELASLRKEKYELYYLLAKCLKKQGIKVTPIAESYLDEYGMPTKNAKTAKGLTISLKTEPYDGCIDGERGIYAVRC